MDEGIELAVVEASKPTDGVQNDMEEIELNENPNSPQEDNNESAQLLEDPPSWYRWIVVFCSFVVTMFCIGLNYSLGPFVEDLGRLLDEYNYDSEDADIKWIVYISIFLTFFTALFAGPMANTEVIGPRITAFIGALLSTIGLFASTFAMSTAILCVTYGALTGIGYGLLLTPCLGLIPRYFQNDYKRYDFANAAAFLGTSIFFFIMPPLQEIITERYGRRYVFTILACLNAQLLIVSALLRPITSRANSRTDLDKSGDSASGNDKLELLGKLLDVRLFKKPLFVAMVFAMFCIGCGHYILVLHLREHAYNGGTTEEQSNTLPTIFGVALVAGIVIHAVASLPMSICDDTDRDRVENWKVNHTDKVKLVKYCISLIVVGGVAIFGFIADTYAGHLALTVIIGVCAGIYLPLTVSILRVFIRGTRYEKSVSIDSKWRVTAALGLSLPFYGLGAFVGLSVGDILNEVVGHYNSSYFLAGVSLAFACVILLVRGGTRFFCSGPRQNGTRGSTENEATDKVAVQQPVQQPVTQNVIYNTLIVNQYGPDNTSQRGSGMIDDRRFFRSDPGPARVTYT